MLDFFQQAPAPVASISDEACPGVNYYS